MSPPRLFISYSWSSQDHEFWVINLATQLRESGVDVILDKWELKEGHDSIAFMEKMVTDPAIEKVVVISDKKYAEKADGRAGGVGTETQIISREVYEKQDQNKFVAILPERDREGKPYLPTYYKGRIYIDLSSPDNYASEFERLVRWVFDKPLHVKPEIGKAPAFLEEDSAKSLGTSAAFRRCIDALKNGKPFAEGAVDEYLTLFSENLERFRVVLDDSKDKDEQIADNIEAFAPYKNEFAQVILAVAQYASSDDIGRKLHRFFEQLLPYMHYQEKTGSHHSWSFDNFRFIIHELYLYAIAILIRFERFLFTDKLLATPYFVSTNSFRGRDAAGTFSDFREHMESFEKRSRKMRLLSSRACLLKQRAESAGFDFVWLMQADFVLYLRDSLQHNGYVGWWPETLVYASHPYGPMEVFARSRSASYYEAMSKLLGGTSAEDLRDHIQKLEANHNMVPRWQHRSIALSVMTGIDRLASIP